MQPSSTHTEIPLRSLLTYPVLLSISNYVSLAFLNIAINALFPLFLAMPIDIAFILSPGRGARLGTGFAINAGACISCGNACGMNVGSVLLLRTLLPSSTAIRLAMALGPGSVVARPRGRF